MKKTVKLLSFVLLVSMLFSMMAAGASAIVSDTPAGNGGGIVLGGGGNAAVNPGGSLIIGGDQRPEDDSPFTGARADELDSESAYQAALKSARTANEEAVAAAAQEAALKYTKQADGDYSGIIDSEYELVQENEDFLMYIRDNIDSVDDATLQTAVDLFGDEAVYGKEDATDFDDEAAQADIDEIDAQLAELEVKLEDLNNKLTAIETAGIEAGNDYTQDPDYQALDAEYQNINDQMIELETKRAGIDMAMTNSQSQHMILMAPVPANKIVSNFSAVCPGYSSLAEAVASRAYNNVLTFNGNSFDICNSTDYRITVDLHSATIDARQSPAAFTIRNGRYGGTVTFTNGTIVGDGFYVTSGGVLNLGGLVNGNYVDITVFAQNNAVYVESTGTCVIGQGTTLVGGIPGNDPLSWTYRPDATQYTTYSSSPVVYINGGAVKMTGGTVVAGSVDGLGANANNNAIYVTNNGSLEISSSVAEVRSSNPNAPAIYALNGAKVDVHAGYIYGPTGIAITGQSSTLTVNGGAITGFATASEEFPNTGSAVAVDGDATEKAGTSPLVYIYGGTLRAERTAGLVTIPRPADAAARALITRVAVDDVNVTIQQKNGEVSDYAKSLFIVTISDNGKITNYGCSTLDVLTSTLSSAPATSTVEIRLMDDMAVSTKGIVLDSPATKVIFDGNGHSVRTTKVNGITINKGDVTVKNVYLDGNHDADGILVTSGKAYVGPNVTVGHYNSGLHTKGNAITTVNGLDIEAHNTKGFLAEGESQTTVIMCKVDTRTPVDGKALTAGKGFLRLDGGWFAYKEDVAGITTPIEKVAAYVDPDTSFVKYVEKDRYYEVLYNDTPNIEIDTTITTRYGNEPQPDGTVIPYIIYDKSNPDPIVFKEVMPALVQIDAVGIITDTTRNKVVETGKVYPIFSADDRGKGVTGTIRIPDRAVLADLPSGRYDLRFTFKNDYVMQDKLRLYVFPKYAGLFAVPNNNEISPSNAEVTATNPYAFNEYFNGNIVEYLNNNFDLIKTNTAYPIGAIGWNVAIVTSELPDKVTIGNAADNTNSILLENYIFDPSTATGYVGINDNAATEAAGGAQDRTTWGVVPSGPYQGYYFYIISYADLNNLSAGQNWVFLNWNGMDGALKNLPLTIKNDYVSISPTTVKWSKINGDVTFTIRPTCDAVYIDGELVPSGYWTYDPSTHVMTLKGTYLGAMDAKDHMLEVVTGLGKASATITTGMGLMANGIDYHVYGQNRVVSFAASDRINQDGGVWIGSSNPTRLDPSAYTWNGTNGFTLNSAFLNRLALGTYYISAYVYNGSNGYNYTTTTFRVISATQASNNPATGDDSNITLWLVILALSAVAIVVIAVPQFKKKKGMH